MYINIIKKAIKALKELNHSDANIELHNLGFYVAMPPTYKNNSLVEYIFNYEGINIYVEPCFPNTKVYIYPIGSENSLEEVDETWCYMIENVYLVPDNIETLLVKGFEAFEE